MNSGGGSSGFQGGGPLNRAVAHAAPRVLHRGTAALPAARTRAVIWGGGFEEGFFGPLLGLPRILAPVANVPLISYGLSWLRGEGVPEICVASGFDFRLIRKHLDPKLEPIEFYHDRMPRGPGGSIRDAWCSSDQDHLLVIEGSVIPDFDLASLLSAHERSGAAMTILVQPDPGHDQDYSVPLGVYILSPKALTEIPEGGYCDIKESLIPSLHEKDCAVLTYVTDGIVVGGRDLNSYLAVNKWMIEKVGMEEGVAGDAAGRAPFEAEGKGGSPKSGRFTRIGPVLFGRDCEIGEGAVLVGPLALGEGCRIGRRAVVSRSVLWSGATVGDGAVVDHVVVGDHGTVESGRHLCEDVIASEAD